MGQLTPFRVFWRNRDGSTTIRFMGGTSHGLALYRAALAIARDRDVKRILWIADATPPKAPRNVTKKILCFVSDDALVTNIETEGYRAFDIPTFAEGRMERIRLAIVAAMSHGAIARGDTVVAVVSPAKTANPDLLAVLVSGEGEGAETLGPLDLSGTDVDPEAFETLLEVATQVGSYGREGRPVGALFVIGDSVAVMERSNALTLNPFQGYGEAERNLLDPKVRAAILNFAGLDGAFVIRGDGVVLAAGRHLLVTEPVPMPLGLGARHYAAAAVSNATSAIGVAVSQTSGCVRLFRGGKLVLEVRPTLRRAVVAPTLPEL
jgi:DNA integrity scanning protein DisA with diadenylate cyclase activity